MRDDSSPQEVLRRQAFHRAVVVREHDSFRRPVAREREVDAERHARRRGRRLAAAGGDDQNVGLLVERAAVDRPLEPGGDGVGYDIDQAAAVAQRAQVQEDEAPRAQAATALGFPRVFRPGAAWRKCLPRGKIS